MQRGLASRIAMALIFPIVFNVAFFVLTGTEHPVSVWTAYAFIQVAYVLVLLTSVATTPGPGAPVFGFALGTTAGAYFVLELLVGLVIIVLAPATFDVALIVQVVLAGIFVFLWLAHHQANQHTAQRMGHHAAEREYVREATARVESLLGGISDRGVRRTVERAYDVLRSSPTRSSAAAHGDEQDILASVNRLERAVSDGNVQTIRDAAQHVVAATEARNRKLRASR